VGWKRLIFVAMLTVSSGPVGMPALMAWIIMARYFNSPGGQLCFKMIGLQNSLSVTLLLWIQRNPSPIFPGTDPADGWA
jgi:hypothetical protein